MIDPIAEVVTLLQPSAPFSKLVSAAGRWGVSRVETGRPYHCVILDGACQLVVAEQPPMLLEQGDFVLIPSVFHFRMSSLEAPAEFSSAPPVLLPDGEFRHGEPGVPPDVRMLVGYCVFGSTDAALLVSLLPQLVHVRGEYRLATLVQLVREESRERRPAREVILARLLEVLLIEALRSTGSGASPGLLRGLADERLSVALRHLHESPARPWTVAQLAKEAGLSRTVFFERFQRAVGLAPMAYLLGWRMVLAKDLLRKGASVSEVAQRVGYSSASTFSVAFTRHVGLPPTHYVNRLRGGEAGAGAAARA
jgi:AraC-like DNA-binding protein